MQADGMSGKSIVGVIILIMAINAVTSFSYVQNSKAETLQTEYYVDDDYNESTPGWQTDHFNFIQDAINVSSAGEKIVVYAGCYNETLTISHKLDVFGEGKSITTIDGKNNGTVITISAAYVNISSFTIKNSGNSQIDWLIDTTAGNTIITDNILTLGRNAIILNNSDDNIIYDNDINNNSGYGLYLSQSDTNQITYNTVDNNKNGIFLYSSSSNTITNNPSIKNNDINGIFLNETSNLNNIWSNNISNNDKNSIFLNDHCNYNNISKNQIYINEDSGVRIENSSYNTLYDNTIIDNTNYGVMIVGSGNSIIYNEIEYNDEHGIFLFADDNNHIYNNDIIGNTKDGIRLSNSTNDSIYRNNIESNIGYGVYLNYFSIDNKIYDNLLFYNANNAMDKSINENKWNITKTSGTNIVGGSNISGNYWSNFDEISEGATDPDEDGISNDPLTIYAGNKDYGPILDVTTPSMSTPQISPTNQTIGSSTNISCVITDNTEIKNVYLCITDPNNQLDNFSITQNKTGNTYYCNKEHIPVGTYTCFITSKDPRNWVSSTSQTFHIKEGTPPSVTDNTPTTGHTSESFIFNATVTDDEDPASLLTVKVNWNHGSNNGNTTLVNVAQNFFEIAVELDNSTSPIVYSFYAKDRWNNSIYTDSNSVSVVDEISPEIQIDKHNYSTDGVITNYTIGATITDNHEVINVTIEYWYGQSEHQTTSMDRKSSNYYEKVIYLDEMIDVYCIISVSDPSDNQNDTKNPFANAGGPYNGIVGTEITFSGADSFDLDCNISEYNWDFGDGTNSIGKTVNHEYSTNGNYTVTLTVTDDEDNTNSDSTYANVITVKKVKTTSSTLNEIEAEYNVSLENLFYAYDTDGDDIVDTFIDPNNVLNWVHTGSINISDNIVFLLSTENDYIPEFMWNSTTDKIIKVNYIEGTTDDPTIDEIENTVTTYITVNKTEGWIYIKIDEPDIDKGEITDIMSVTKNDVEIDSDKIIRKDGKVYVLDDPDITYKYIFIYEPITLTNAIFSPSNYGTINENNPTVTITYNVAVSVTLAEFTQVDPDSYLPLTDGVYLDIEEHLITDDNIFFIYTPPSDLPTGTYQLYIFSIEQGSTNTIEDSAYYDFISYTITEEGFNLFGILPYIGIIAGICIAIFLLLRKINIRFESFIYIKNKKIIPFLKPIVFGPLSIDVNDKKVSKAEFYLNGQLKDTLTQAPYTWNWDEPAFFKQKIETKVFDQEGNSNSTGEMTFYIFNPHWFSK